MDTREVAEVLHMSEGTTFLLKGTFLNVVDVTEFTWPIDDERRPFLDTGVCGTDLST